MLLGLGWILSISVLSSPLQGASITLVIDQVPVHTPEGSALYLAASFNQWRTDAEAYQFSFSHDGTYQLHLEDVPLPFEYKITRGSWATVEADVAGQGIANRSLDQVPPNAEVHLQVKGWIGVPEAQPLDSLRIVVEQVPENTPEDARIYITGSFNSWQTGLAEYRLRPQGDGTYATTVPVYRDTVEYKFTRGKWENVEGRASGRARFNRKVILDRVGEGPVRVSIQSWEDLSGTPVNGYTVFWLMAAIQGLLILLAINTLGNHNAIANRLLSLLLLVMSVSLIGRVVVYDREVFNWAPKLILVPDLIYFLYAPIFVGYIHRLLRSDPDRPHPKQALHLLPFGVHLIGYLPLFLMNEDAFIIEAINLQLRPIFILVGGLALAYNLGYWFHARQLIQQYQYESDHTYSAGSNLAFLHTILSLKGICLVLWLATYVIGAYGSLTGTEVMFITDRTTDALWVGFSLTAFLLGYFAMKEPEIFRLPEAQKAAPTLPDGPTPPLPQRPAEASPAEVPAEAGDTDLEPRKQHLIELMEKEQPYLNPKLTLPDLAGQAGETVHDLSRTINQGFGMNFNDFVNSYRVDAFKEKVVLSKYQNHTFLAVALMVGFNSKTAFNRSFKKLAGQTPREFFQAATDEDASARTH